MCVRVCVCGTTAHTFLQSSGQKLPPEVRKQPSVGLLSQVTQKELLLGSSWFFFKAHSYASPQSNLKNAKGVPRALLTNPSPFRSILSMHVSSFLKKELHHLCRALADGNSKRSVSQLKGEIICLRITQKSQASFGKEELYPKSKLTTFGASMSALCSSNSSTRGLLAMMAAR